MCSEPLGSLSVDDAMEPVAVVRVITAHRDGHGTPQPDLRDEGWRVSPTPSPRSRAPSAWWAGAPAAGSRPDRSGRSTNRTTRSRAWYGSARRGHDHPAVHAEPRHAILSGGHPGRHPTDPTLVTKDDPQSLPRTAPHTMSRLGSRMEPRQVPTARIHEIARCLTPGAQMDQGYWHCGRDVLLEAGGQRNRNARQREHPCGGSLGSTAPPHHH
jgi:hypothetical protein